MALYMKQTMRANRNLLQKRKSYKEIREIYNVNLGKTKIKSSEISVEQLRDIRIKIKKQERNKLVKQQLILLSILVVIAILAFLFVTELFPILRDNVKQSNELDELLKKGPY